MKRQFGYFFLLIAIVMGIGSPLFAQRHKMDSLLNVLKAEKEDTNKVNTLIKCGEMLFLIDNDDSTLICGNEALALAEKLNYKRGKADAFSMIGTVYYSQGSFPKALKYCFDAQKILVELGNKGAIANGYNNIGNIYSDQGDNAKAIEYYEKALDLNQKAGNKNGIANNYGNLGTIYNSLKDYPKALEAYQKSLTLHEEVGNKKGMTNNLGNMGSVYKEQGNYSKAMEYFTKALSIARENGYKRNLEVNLGNIGNVYVLQKKYKQAKQYLDSSLAIANEIKERENIMEIYENKFMLDSASGDYKKGVEDYRIYIAYRDSLINEATTKTEMKLEFEQKQAAAKAEADRKEAVDAQEKKIQIIIRNAFIGGFLLILIVAFLLYARYSNKAKTARLLEEQNHIINERNAELERLSIVARETENLILILDPEGRIEWANESFARVNGITIEELKKQKGETIYEVSNNPEIRNIISIAINEKRTVVYESLNQNKEGERIWESSTLTPIFDKAGKLRKIIIIDTDITKRKNDEEIIKQKNKDITDSIHYAKRLQDAILPPITEVKKFLPESFVLYKPKDIVAGDFYWIEKIGDVILIAAADCTGHGVPGAMVSVVCSNAMNSAVKEFNLIEPGKILDKTRELLAETFKKAKSEVNDGMDVSLAAISYQASNGSLTIEWAGANNPLCYVQNNKLQELMADKQPVGNYEIHKPFSTHTLKLQKGDILYLFTDGYADQFGGEKGKKFKYQQLHQQLLAISQHPMEEQKQKLEKVFEEWKGELEQVDDVLVIGIRI